MSDDPNPSSGAEDLYVKPTKESIAEFLRKWREDRLAAGLPIFGDFSKGPDVDAAAAAPAADSS